MPAVDVIDETYAAVAPDRLRDALCAESAWALVLPELELRCFEDRGVRGKRWAVSGALEGTAEVWLERLPEGTVVHVFLQADPAVPLSGPTAARRARQLDTACRVRLKRWVTHVRDALDESRAVGEAPRWVADDASVADEPGDGAR